MHLVERVLNLVGRTVETVLTGRSEFRLTTSEFHQTPSVHDPVQARMVLAEVQKELASSFGMRLADPVLLDLERPPVWGWKAAFATADGQIGRYVPRRMGEQRVHRIVIVPGLDRGRFRGVVAHELTHAWQAERVILRRSRGLREGMARWIEYHVLCKAGREAQAKKLLALRRYSLGRSLRDILEREQREGREATLRWLETVDEC